MPTREQFRALATELVDFVRGEPRRFEEEEAAKTKNKAANDQARKDRLVDEVMKKIEAATEPPAEETTPAPAGVTPTGHGQAGEPPSTPSKK